MPHKIVTVTIDRPLGSLHPEYPDLRYNLNYGYVEGISSPDGDWQDAYIMGIDKPVSKFKGQLIAEIQRSDDMENKWVVAPIGTTFTAEEIRSATFFQERYFKSEIYML